LSGAYGNFNGKSTLFLGPLRAGKRRVIEALDFNKMKAVQRKLILAPNEEAIFRKLQRYMLLLPCRTETEISSTF